MLVMKLSKIFWYFFFQTFILCLPFLERIQYKFELMKDIGEFRDHKRVLGQYGHKLQNYLFVNSHRNFQQPFSCLKMFISDLTVRESDLTVKLSLQDQQVLAVGVTGGA